MDEPANPYESPRTAGTAEVSEPAGQRQDRQFRACFWFGVFLAMLGSMITLKPGTEMVPCLIVAGLLGMGVFVPSRSYQVAGVLGCLFFLLAAWGARQRGIEYQRYLEKNGGQLFKVEATESEHDPAAPR